ncbi:MULTISPECIES: lysophospholipid acyltransferase family protein [unclassified Janibacter]|uniref:lysophospholipid acyltransferase family protein n=1 Tax=unclassified Janibacter TaxID=2649294 RepID=UPI003CFF0586
MEPGYQSVIVAARTAFFAQGLSFRVRGEEHVPKTGGAIMAINHTGYLDFLYAGLAARKSGRYVRFMAKKSIWSHRWAGKVMRSLKHIPVDRQAGVAAFQMAVQRLKDGEIVGVYPEATMSRSFEIKELKTGAVRMAQLAGVPILPTIVWGAQRVWTKDNPKNLKRSNIPIFVTVGEPFHIAKGENAKDATLRLREVMRTMLDESIAAYPEMTGSDLAFLPARFGGTAPTPEEAFAHDERDMKRTKDEFTD